MQSIKLIIPKSNPMTEKCQKLKDFLRHKVNLMNCLLILLIIKLKNMSKKSSIVEKEKKQMYKTKL